MVKRYFLLFISTVFLCQYLVGQTVADSLRHEGDLNGAIAAFAKEFAKNPTNQNNLYNYACALAVAEQKDSCFKYLNLAAVQDTAAYFLTDPDFLSIKDDARWTVFENKLIDRLNSKGNNTIKDIEYAKKLWNMQATDQAYYSEMRLARNKIGTSSTVEKALWTLKEILNKKNQQQLEELVAQKGWPKISQVGKRAASAAFLVVQHAELPLQKKYLPIINNFCEQKEASWKDYALLYDRVQMREKKPQKYGSQISYNDSTKAYELYPLEDETKVEEWRKNFGMQPLADYLLHWNLKFEPKKKE